MSLDPLLFSCETDSAGDFGLQTAYDRSMFVHVNSAISRRGRSRTQSQISRRPIKPTRANTTSSNAFQFAFGHCPVAISRCLPPVGESHPAIFRFFGRKKGQGVGL